jgi:hypothetical protein
VTWVISLQMVLISKLQELFVELELMAYEQALNCFVERLTNQQVTWVQPSKLQVLFTILVVEVLQLVLVCFVVQLIILQETLVKH